MCICPNTSFCCKSITTIFNPINHSASQDRSAPGARPAVETPSCDAVPLTSLAFGGAPWRSAAPAAPAADVCFDAPAPFAADTALEVGWSCGAVLPPEWSSGASLQDAAACRAVQSTQQFAAPPPAEECGAMPPQAVPPSPWAEVEAPKGAASQAGVPASPLAAALAGVATPSRQRWATADAGAGHSLAVAPTCHGRAAATAAAAAVATAAVPPWEQAADVSAAAASEELTSHWAAKAPAMLAATSPSEVTMGR